MIKANRYCIPLLFLSALLLPIPAALAQTTEPATYPQIVRLSLVEGDVRVSRGEDGEKASGSAWEKAAIDVPLETGFSVVTGTGRAEIEFEDASTVYLADNSVLTFKELSTTGGVPFTSVALLSGTMTVHLQMENSGAQFYVTTPFGGIHQGAPGHAFVRVDSYLDAMALTPQENSAMNIAGKPVAVRQGQTSVYRNGRRISVNGANDPGSLAEWDKWVADRVDARNTALLSAMKASGLSTPVPGLAEMNGEGRFFACAPYGTCWEPTDGWNGQGREGEAALQNVAQTSQSVAQRRLLTTEEEDDFPCSPLSIRYLYEKDPLTLKPRLIDSRLYCVRNVIAGRFVMPGAGCMGGADTPGWWGRRGTIIVRCTG